MCLVFFFFQAEDGIRDYKVTGVQTCALPISNWFSVFFSIVVTAYFWWSNIKGVPESSGKALRIMQITTVMVVILLIWCPLTLLLRGSAHLPPLPTPSNLHLSHDSWGWLDGTFWTQFSFV